MTRTPLTDSQIEALIVTWVAAYNAVPWLTLRSRLDLALRDAVHEAELIPLHLTAADAKALLRFADLDLQTQK